MTTK
jgi:hypothetical protein